MKCFIGIDPGKFGAAAAIFEDGRYCIHDWQSEKAAAKIIWQWSKEFECLAAVEKVQAVRSRTYYPNMKLAQNAGFWRGLLVACNIEFCIILLSLNRNTSQ